MKIPKLKIANLTRWCMSAIRRFGIGHVTQYRREVQQQTPQVTWAPGMPRTSR